MNYQKLLVIGSMTMMLAACDNAEFAAETRAVDSASNLSSASTSTAIASAPATRDQVLQAIEKSRSPDIKEAFASCGAPIEELSPNRLEPVAVADSSSPYAGSGATVSCQPSSFDRGVPNSPNNGCKSVPQATAEVVSIIGDKCHQLFPGATEKDIQILQQDLARAIQLLQSLNLTNIAAELQQLVQGHLIVLRRLETCL